MFDSRRNGSRRNGNRQNGSRRNGSRRNGNIPLNQLENLTEPRLCSSHGVQPLYNSQHPEQPKLAAVERWLLFGGFDSQAFSWYLTTEYQAVYLKISRPTAGRGVELNFHGYERFSYPSKPDGYQLNPDKPPFREHRDYIHMPCVKLYETKEPLCIGNSGIPFKIRLPLEIPGTFHGDGMLDGSPWEAKVEYTLEAQVIDANELKAKQLVIILQHLPEGILPKDTPKAVYKTHPIRFIFVFKKNMHVIARLLQNVHRAGETLYLRVIITNNTSTVVTSLHLQLLRQIKLISKQGSEYKAQYVEDWVPVGKPQELDMANCPKGFDKLHIPLRNMDNSSLFPSVDGFHIKCLYKLDIEVRLSNNDVIRNFHVPVPVIISEKNKEWLEWTVPEWISHDSLDIIETESNFSVPRNVLQTEPFSTVPGIQRL